MDSKDTVLQALNELVKNGGEGSGDFNHAGNPPHVGGSEPVGSRQARGFKSKSERKEVKKEKNKETPLIPKVNPSEPYNPNRKNTPEIQNPTKKEDGDDFQKILEPLIKPKQKLNKVIDFNQKLKEKYKEKEEDIKTEDLSSYKCSIIKEYKGVKEDIRQKILGKSNRIDKILKIAGEKMKKNDVSAKFDVKLAEDIMKEIDEHEKEIKYANEQIQEVLKMKTDNNYVHTYMEY